MIIFEKLIIMNFPVLVWKIFPPKSVHQSSSTKLSWNRYFKALYGNRYFTFGAKKGAGEGGETFSSWEHLMRSKIENVWRGKFRPFPLPNERARRKFLISLGDFSAGKKENYYFNAVLISARSFFFTIAMWRSIHCLNLETTVGIKNCRGDDKGTFILTN